jgi:hypothetical protein
MVSILFKEFFLHSTKIKREMGFKWKKQINNIMY